MAADFLPIPSTPPRRRPATAALPPPPRLAGRHRHRSPPLLAAAALCATRPAPHARSPQSPRNLTAIFHQSPRNLPAISPQSPRHLRPHARSPHPPYSPPLSLAPVLAARASTALTAARGISRISLAPKAHCSMRRSMCRGSRRLGSTWAASLAPSAGTRRTCGCSHAAICMQEPPRHGT